MFRPQITEEMKKTRENGAIHCLRHIKNYVGDVAYGDTQRFSYNDQGKISLYFGSEREVHNTVLVWGCVSSSHPKALLLRVNEKFNSATYKEIPQKHVLPLSDKDQSQPIGLVSSSSL
ncbi:hypothetical protein OUZ56_012976 [Daphnia magna]|uniref:Uncharacterized protein n=1 Tax=Daphnia magna TaxID=35525 RepID=A0ABQ9Z5C7_9CRUS|nr:hypothetical protein OUZ56_012976 [Daphnia magna]